MPFFAAFSYVFETVYDFSTPSTGLTYIGQAVGSFVGFLILLYTYRFYWANIAEKLQKQDPEAKMSPDKRLIVAKIGAPMLPVS